MTAFLFPSPTGRGRREAQGEDRAEWDASLRRALTPALSRTRERGFSA